MKKITFKELSSRFQIDSEFLIVEETLLKPQLNPHTLFKFNKIETEKGTYNHLEFWWPDNIKTRIILALVVLVFILGVVYLIKVYPQPLIHNDILNLLRKLIVG